MSWASRRRGPVCGRAYGTDWAMHTPDIGVGQNDLRAGRWNTPLQKFSCAADCEAYHSHYMLNLFKKFGLLCFGVTFMVIAWGTSVAAHEAGRVKGDVALSRNANLDQSRIVRAEAPCKMDCPTKQQRPRSAKGNCCSTAFSCCLSLPAALSGGDSVAFHMTRVRHDRRLAEDVLASAIPDPQLRPPRFFV